MTYEANIVITHDEDGYYAFCLQLPGCHANGETLSVVLENMRAAIARQMATLNIEDIEGAFKMEVITTTMEVEYQGSSLFE